MLSGTVPGIVPASSSAGSKKKHPKGQEVTYRCNICAGNPINADSCRGISGVSRNNARCAEFNCDSPWRVCRACILLGDAKLEKKVVKNGLCQFHIDHGTGVRVSAEVKEIIAAEADETAAKAAQADVEADEAREVGVEAETEAPVPVSRSEEAEKASGVGAETKAIASAPRVEGVKEAREAEATKAAEENEGPRKSARVPSLIVAGQEFDDSDKKETTMSDFFEFIKELMGLRGLSIEDLAEKTKISKVDLQGLEKGVAVDLIFGMARQIIVALCLGKPEIESFISLASKAGVIQKSTQRELKAAIPGLVKEIEDSGGREGGNPEEGKLKSSSDSQDKTAAVAPDIIDTIPVKELLNSINDREGHGKFIRKMMQRFSLRIKDFKEETGMSNANVTLLKRGSIPNPKTAAKIAQAFGFNEEDTVLYLQISKELRKREGPYNLPIQGQGKQPSPLPQPSSFTGKFDGPLAAKKFIRLLLFDARKRLAEETPGDKRFDLLLEQAGLGEDNIATSDINLVSLRELCSLLDLTDGEKATVAELLKFVQNEFAVTIKGRNTELIKLFLFGSK